MDKQFIVKLLDSFPESLDPIVSTTYGETDLIKVVLTLTMHGKWIANRSGSNSGMHSTATADTVKALEATIHVLQAQVNGLSRKQPNSDKKCSNCNWTGHVVSDCFWEGGRKQGQYPSW
ncbi:hypothetical protein J132_04707 [Termitomyces sp. J132]|nr:hypothetical protein J132_04707 [Termitomyces sp. J132]